MELVEGMYASAFTKKTLEQFGWKDGNAIPADLGQLMLSIKEKLPVSSRTDVLIVRENMTPEQITSIEEMLKEAIVVSKRRKEEQELEEKTQNMAPDVAEAYKKLMASAPQIVDDREEVAAEPAPTTVPEPAVEKAPDVLEEIAAEVTPLPDVSNVVAFCPRCGWDMRLKFDVVPTDRDKEDFLATLLGGARFRKRYELFGGRVVVTLRSVLADENKLIYRQLVIDQQNSLVNTEAEWFVQLMDYRLACALDTISDKNGKVLASVPELDMGSRDKEKTALVEQLDLINKNILAQEATRRLVGTHLRQFQRLTEALEAMAVEPNFWNGIE